MKAVLCQIILLLIICTALTPMTVCSTSLWESGRGYEGGYYSEQKAVKVGDIVTVIIVERATASNKASTQNKKSTKLSTTAGTGPLDVIKGMDTQTENDFQGNGETSRTTRLETHVSARVIKSLPGGNLVIEGSKINLINDERQEIKVRGTIRPVDISSNNEILSTAIADADIRLTGRGPTSQTARPSILSRLFGLIF